MKNLTAMLLLLLTACGGEAKTDASASASAAKPTASTTTAAPSAKPAASATVAAVTASPTASPAGDAGGTSTGFDSVEALGKAYVDAANKNEEATTKAIFISDASMDQLFQCEGDNPNKKIVHDEIAKVKEAKPHPEAPLTFVSAEVERVKKAIKKGEKQSACTALADFEVVKLKIAFKTAKGKADEVKSDGVKVGDKVFFVDP